DSRIQMFDISNPAEPISKGWYYTCGTRINSMLIDKSSNKSNLFVANELALTILEIDSEVGTTEINSNTNLQTQIAPNPASSIAYLDINLPSHNKVEAKLYNLNGQLVKTLVNQEFMSGRLQLELDISNVPAGVYMVEVNTNEHRKTEKLIIK
ncbi:MAG: T9SS type A sorting domain-containing protein, partial [Bacteroidales bacterium]|nr:T9SS type A sorting domain-containing protein [Bacteroidales bacterium]